MAELRQLLRTMDQEIPDTAAAVRLSSLEMADAIEEVSLLRCSTNSASWHPNIL